MTGYIYIMKSKSLPGLLKIGLTRNIEKRIKSASNASIPEPFEAVDTYEVNDLKKAESTIHRALSEYHYKKEFFNCCESIAQQVCLTVQSEINDFIESNIDIDDEFDKMLSNIYH